MPGWSAQTPVAGEEAGVALGSAHPERARPWSPTHAAAVERQQSHRDRAEGGCERALAAGALLFEARGLAPPRAGAAADFGTDDLRDLRAELGHREPLGGRRQRRRVGGGDGVVGVEVAASPVVVAGGDEADDGEDGESGEGVLGFFTEVMG
jgi:hypothetical protein